MLEEVRPGMLARMFASLRHRNYRLFFLGQALSLPGNSMQLVGEAWLTYRVTGSALALGTVSFVALLPVVPISLFGGGLIDRVNRRKLVVATQLLLLLNALAWAAIAWRGTAQVWQLVLLSFLEGAIASIDLPARQSFLPEMVGMDDLPNTIALNQFLTNLVRIAGPAVAGVVIARAGESACFLANAASFLPLIGCLLLMRGLLRPARPAEAAGGPIQGLRYLLKAPVILWLLVVMVASNFLLLPYQTLMPAITDRLWKAGPEGLGLVMTGIYVGAMAGSLWLANLDVAGQRRWLVLTLYALPISIIGFVGVPTLAAAIAVATLVGAGTTWMQTILMTLVQTTVREDVRGRTVALHLMLQVGSIKVGAVGAGLATELVGVGMALRLIAALSLVCTTVALRLRPSFETRRAAVPVHVPAVE